MLCHMLRKRQPVFQLRNRFVLLSRRFELLNIEEIKASFVLTEYNGKIYISARSIDEINVQIIMERLGGGGHINTAGAQFPYSDMERAIETLKKTIDIMIEEGDI